MQKTAHQEISVVRRRSQLNNKPATAQNATAPETIETKASAAAVDEFGGPKGLEPTRYGDWEAKGRCYDF